MGDLIHPYMPTRVQRQHYSTFTDISASDQSAFVTRLPNPIENSRESRRMWRGREEIREPVAVAATIRFWNTDVRVSQTIN
ncbi:MAG TPA: hypothetical protein VHG92_07390 [Afifellaceae bacterium]|nr:hypothetical protein [Afifellaceae bacterium]